MTVATDMIGLLPLLWATGTGSDVTRRLVAPLVGGITVSFVMELLVYPVIFYLVKHWQLRREWETTEAAMTERTRGLTRVRSWCAGGALLAGLAPRHPAALSIRGASGRSATWRARPGARRRPSRQPLAADASLEEILDYAYAANADLERLYWEWIAALEAIPQEASPGTNLAISVESMFEEGETSLSRTTLGVGNDPMARPALAGQARHRRASGRSRWRAPQARRFEAGKLDLRARVLAAYYAYALLGENLEAQGERDLAPRDRRRCPGARVRAGTASSEPRCSTPGTDRDLAANDLENLKARVPVKPGRAQCAPGPRGRRRRSISRGNFPQPRDLPYTDAEILAFLAERNPELAALAHEVAAGERERHDDAPAVHSRSRSHGERRSRRHDQEHHGDAHGSRRPARGH